jgi:NTE family protein
MKRTKKVGLALGSGASKGWAHIGIIEALEQANIPIDFVAGCSVGAYIGAIYASGSLQSLKEFLLKVDGKKIFSYFDVAISRSGLLNGTKRVQELFSMHTDVVTFEELDVPLVMVATDLERGEKVVLHAGNIIDALRATMSCPGLFRPVNMNGSWLVDGGLVDPVPVGVARAMGADIVIAVDLSSRKRSSDRISRHDSAAIADTEKKAMSSDTFSLIQKGSNNILLRKLTDYYQRLEKNKRHSGRQNEMVAPDIFETITASISIMEERITRINLAVDRPDVLIQPRLGELRMMNFDQVEHAIEEGYTCVQEKLVEISRLLE